LETSVLNQLWEERDLAAKELHERLSRERTITLSTVQSTIERLCRKGLVDRTKVSHAFRYRPLVERDAVLQRFVGAMVDQLGQRWSGPALSNFLDLAERMDDTALDELERMIRQRKALRDHSLLSDAAQRDEKQTPSNAEFVSSSEER
jgi:predicted transcriptional regulator